MFLTSVKFVHYLQGSNIMMVPSYISSSVPDFLCYRRFLPFGVPVTRKLNRSIAVVYTNNHQSYFSSHVPFRYDNTKYNKTI